MFIHNQSANAVAWTAGWSLGDENKSAYRAQLLRSYIQVDGGAIFRTVEWIVTKEGDENLIITVPLCFGFRHRNCKILRDEIIQPDEIFAINQAEVQEVGGKFVPVHQDEKEIMAAFKPQVDCHQAPDLVITLLSED